MALVARRFDVFLVALDPTVGHEIRKTRPALVISPDEMNEYLSTFIVAPMTTKGRPYPTRIPCTFQRKQGEIVLDQMKRCLEAAGSSLERVVKCNIYCTDAAHFATFNEVYAKYFPVSSPARIFLCVAPFPGPLDIEVDCIAVV